MIFPRKELQQKYMSISHLKKCSTLFLCVLMYSFTTTVFSQEKDTLIQQLDTIAFKKTLQGKSLYPLVLEMYKEIDVDFLKTSIIAKHIENTYLASENPKEKAGAYISLYVWEVEKGNTDKAMSLVAKGIKISREINNDSLRYLGLLRKGASHFNKADYKPALKLYYEALAIAKKEKNIKNEIFVKNNIALVRLQAKDKEGAIETFLDILNQAGKQPDLLSQGAKLGVYVNICGAYIYLEDYDAAADNCEIGMKINEEKKDPMSSVHLLSAFAEIARSKKEFEKSHQLLDEAQRIMDKRFGKENLSLFLKLYKAKTYYDEQKYQLAVDELLKIEELKSDYDYKHEILGIQEMYYYLAKSYKELGNTEEAIKYYDKAQEIGNENDKKRDEINANLVKKYDLVELKEEIEELQYKSKKTKVFYLLGMLLLGIIIVGLILFNKKQQRKNKARFALLMQQLDEKREKGKLRTEIKHVERKIEAVIEPKESSKIKPAEIDPKMQEILKKLEEFEEKELFISNDNTLVEVAKKIQTNTTYLSKVINTHKEKSFTSYITDLRVDYAIERLSHDRKFRSFTIGAIAQEVGFKRSESFAKAFKVKTGLYPSYFIKELEKQLSSESE